MGTTIRVQHREASEYRVQRQNAAMQAARNLVDVPDMPRAPGVPAGPQGHGYGHGYSSSRGSNVGRPMYYPPYYGYPGIPMPPHGFYGPPPPQPATMMGQSVVPPRGSPTETGQPYYPAHGVYNQQVHLFDVKFCLALPPLIVGIAAPDHGRIYIHVSIGNSARSRAIWIEPGLWTRYMTDASYTSLHSGDCCHHVLVIASSTLTNIF